MNGRAGRLPAYGSSFVGRDREISDLVDLLAEHRLVSVCGVGGAGKTRLAVETARRLDKALGGGEPAVRWVSLGEVHDADLVAHAIADELGIPGAAASNPLTGTCAALAGSRGALVLDNCEQVAAGCCDVLAALLSAAPNLRILLTSRVPLGLTAERVYPIPPLDLGGAALELFVDRAAAVAPIYALTSANRQPIAEICARLDGLPLGIELAASRICILAPRDLLGELTASLDVLSSTEPSLAERHRSIEAVLETTWRSLREADRDVLAGLTTFRGGFTEAAAEAVAGTTVETLHALRDQALVQAITDESGRPRYQLHELVRSYAVCRWTAADPHRAEIVGERHFDYHLALTRQLRQRWNGSTAIDRPGVLWDERANLDAAMLWALERGESNRALRLARALYAFWAYSWPSSNAKRERLERALALPWEPGDQASILARASALIAVGFSWTSLDAHRAHARFDEALRWYRQLGHQSGIAFAHEALGWQYLVDGDLAAAGRHDRESLAIFRSIGHRSGEASCSSALGQIALAAGCWTEAEAQIKESMTLADELDDDFIRYRGHLMLADVRRLTGHCREAVAEYENTLQIQRSAGFTAHGADILEGLGEIAARLDEIELAAELLAAGLAWRRQHDEPRGSFDEDNFTAAANQVQRGLGSEAWRRALDACAGRSTASLEKAAVTGIHQLRAMIEQRSGTLSEREVEVLQLLAQGLSNADIAAQLVVSPRTVAAHLRSVFTKLGVATRTAAAHEAVRIGIARRLRA